MITRIILAVALCFFLGILNSFAQEPLSSDSLLRDRDRVTTPLLHDSLQFQQNTPVISIPQLEIQGIEQLLNQQPVNNNLELNLRDTILEPYFFQPPKFKPQTSFNLGASRWYMPVMGAVTTFSPTLNFQAAKDLNFFGGVGFSQFHNLSYVQSLLAPEWHTKSNIIANGFAGVSYRVHDRVILHGMYQRSLYNQLPNNLMMFAPGHNVVSAGASVDVWQGLGVTVDHVWEFDRYGNMRRGFRYSPYIDLPKFIKFLRQ